MATRQMRSMLVFGIYVTLMGLGLVIVPEAVLAPFGIEVDDTTWVRVVGALALAVAFYYLRLKDSREFAQATLVGRSIFAVVMTVLAFTTGPWQLVIFGAIDVLGAGWTRMELAKE